MTTPGEDALKAFKQAVFNGGQSPTRAFLNFFYDATRWPVDAFSTYTEVDANQKLQKHHVFWLKGQLLGWATYVPGDVPDVSVRLHPLHRVSRIEIGAYLYDQGFEPTVARSMTVVFDDGDQFAIDPGAMSLGWQREPTGSFIDAVLGAAGLVSAER